jgi:hypothetical protein
MIKDRSRLDFSIYGNPIDGKMCYQIRRIKDPTEVFGGENIQSLNDRIYHDKEEAINELIKHNDHTITLRHDNGYHIIQVVNDTHLTYRLEHIKDLDKPYTDENVSIIGKPFKTELDAVNAMHKRIDENRSYIDRHGYFIAEDNTRPDVTQYMICKINLKNKSLEHHIEYVCGFYRPGEALDDLHAIAENQLRIRDICRTQSQSLER